MSQVIFDEHILIDETEINAQTQAGDLVEFLGEARRVDGELPTSVDFTAHFDQTGFSFGFKSNELKFFRIKVTPQPVVYLATSPYTGRVVVNNRTDPESPWSVLDSFEFFDFPYVGMAAFPYGKYTLWVVRDEESIRYVGVEFSVKLLDSVKTGS